MRSSRWFSLKLFHLPLRRVTAYVALFFFAASHWQGASAALTPRSGPDVSPQVAALRALQAVSQTPVQMRVAHGFPRGVHTRVTVSGKDAVERARNYLTQFRDLYRQNNPDLALGVRRVTGPPDENVLFYQTFKGLEVFGGELLVMLRGNEVRATVGGVLNGNIRLTLKPYLSEQQAEEGARQELSRPRAPLLVETKLMVYDRSLFADVKPEPHLAWRVMMGGGIPTQVMIDAHDGRVLFSSSLVHEHNGGALGGFNFQLKDMQGAVESENFCSFKNTGQEVADESSFDPAYNADQDAVPANEHARTAYAFFHENFNWHSYDDSYSDYYDDTSKLEINIHASLDNALWNAACHSMTVGTGFVSRDVITHEFTHGVIQDSSHLLYAEQSGALNESYADIMGALADREWEETHGFPLDWTIGEDSTSGAGPVRDLSNPANPNVLFPQPDHMAAFIPLAANEAPEFETNDYGWVHYNSGIPNKAAFLMVEGFHDVDTFAGMGRWKVAQLKFNALTNLPTNATFADAYDYEVAKVEEWAQYGTNGFIPLDACIVRHAWAMVGVNSMEVGPVLIVVGECAATYPPDSDDDYIPDFIDNCPNTPNLDQENHDLDSWGDACDLDDDGDGILDTVDQCPLGYNFDGINGPCDDIDNDGVKNEDDNCPGDYNPAVFFGYHRKGGGIVGKVATQPDSDGNGWGDACDYDGDGDGEGIGDNCPNVPNPGQEDTDGDLYGDACDFCPLDAHPNPAFTPAGNPLQADSDDDGIGDECDLSPVLVDSIPIPANGISSDGGKRRGVTIEMQPQRSVHIPLEVCPRGCLNGLKLGEYVDLVLTGLDVNIRAWISDDQGNSVKEANMSDEQQELRFRPLGGRQYFLSFASGPAAPRGQTAFSLQMSTQLTPLNPQQLER